MALTNAERQARHRERVKAKLAASNAAPDVRPQDTNGADMLARINAHYTEGMCRAAATVDNSEPAQVAVRQCGALPTLSWDDVLQLAKRAGEQVWTSAFERAAMEWAASLPAPLVEQTPSRGRKRASRTV